MIRRALLIAASAVALSAAGVMTITPGLARAGRSWSQGILYSAFGLTADPGVHRGSLLSGGALRQKDDAHGAFCPVRPAGTEHPALIPANPDARMSIDPRDDAAANSSAIVAESLFTPAPAICRPQQEAAPAQSSVRR